MSFWRTTEHPNVNQCHILGVRFNDFVLSLIYATISSGNVIISVISIVADFLVNQTYSGINASFFFWFVSCKLVYVKTHKKKSTFVRVLTVSHQMHINTK